MLTRSKTQNLGNVAGVVSRFSLPQRQSVSNCKYTKAFEKRNFKDLYLKLKNFVF